MNRTYKKKHIINPAGTLSVIRKETQIKRFFKEGINIVFVTNTLPVTIMHTLQISGFAKKNLKKHIKDHSKVSFKQISNYEE